MEQPGVKAVAVFCGSSPGRRPEYADAVTALGRALAGRGVRVVYGGARVGTMGTLADAVLGAGGEIVGVIPRSMEEREIANRELSDLHVVGTMHERKALMAELADAFVAAPGGLGTLEEWSEISTWAYLGHHTKPVALLNIAGFYDPLLAWLDHASDEGFLRPGDRARILAYPDVASVVDALTGRQAAAAGG